MPDTGVVVPGTWVTIPPTGTTLPVTYSMGSPTSENCRGDNETQHQVTLTHAFEILAYEVTQDEFQSLMGYNPSHFPSCGSNCPVGDVNWDKAVAYCNTLSDQAGLDQCYNCSEPSATVHRLPPPPPAQPSMTSPASVSIAKRPVERSTVDAKLASHLCG